MDYKTYSATLPLAEKIYDQLYGKPGSHEEWAERFNVVGSINLQLLSNVTVHHPTWIERKINQLYAWLHNAVALVILFPSIIKDVDRLSETEKL